MGNLKKFIGEYAYNIIQNFAVDEGKIRKALVTPQNARNVFSDLSEFQIKSLCSEISNSGTIGAVRQTTQKEITDAFNSAGYNTVIFDDEEKIAKCEKYYAKSETICTYRDLKGRMSGYHILVAIKKDIDTIKRSKTPDREDEYGTSILNIQIAKNGSHMSIKNRYNHTVSQPDNTLNNNLDALHIGLQRMVLGYYGFACLNSNKSSYNDIVNIDNTYLKCSIEKNNIYYGSFVLDGVHGVRYTDTSRYCICVKNDYYSSPFILDFKEKKAINLNAHENIKLSLMTRALKENVLSSENKENYNKLQYVFHDAKKELLQCRRNALQWVHEVYGYDFTKPCKITAILGNFTANNIKKITGSNTGILLMGVEDSVKPVELNNGSFTIPDKRLYEYNIDHFYIKGGFEKARKSGEAATYIIQQDKEYIKTQIKSIPQYSDNNKNVFDKSGCNLTEIHTELQRRLKTYKTKKRAEEVSKIDYSQDIINIDNSFNNFKSELIEKLLMATDQKEYNKISNVSGYKLSWLVGDIQNFKEKVLNNNLSSINNTKEKIKDIQAKIKGLMDIITT